MECSYQKGYTVGYDEGHSDGYDEGIDERSCMEYEKGNMNAVNSWNSTLSYSELIKLQEKTGHQICYGDEVDYAAAAQAIKHLIEIS